MSLCVYGRLASRLRVFRVIWWRAPNQIGVDLRGGMKMRILNLIIIGWVSGWVFSGCSTAQTKRVPASSDGDNSAVSWEARPSIQSRNGIFQVDAAAILQTPIGHVLANAIDYESYVAKKVPMVVEAHVVENSNDSMIVWFHTSLDGHTAEYYLKVQVEKNPHSSEFAKVSWELTPRESHWSYPENQAVKQLSGYCDMKSGSTPDTTEVKYHQLFQSNTSVPSFILGAFIKSAFINEASSLFEIMAQ
jgi:hypothetical protein